MKSLLYKSAVLVVAAAALLGRPAAARAQEWNGLEATATRAALEERLSLYDRAAQSPAYSDVLRGEARDQADLIRQRLDQGDFRPGDRLYVTVESYPELTDTFTVSADRRITIPNAGAVNLRGVLRSEAQDTVHAAVARIIREPEVRVRAFVRVLIDGAVAVPGYYLVDSNMPVPELLRQAGGQTSEARLEAARIQRGTEVIVAPDQIQQALRSGLTVDHLGLRDGDHFSIPGSRTSWLGVARDVVYVVPAVIGLVALLL